MRYHLIRWFPSFIENKKLVFIAHSFIVVLDPCYLHQKKDIKSVLVELEWYLLFVFIPPLKLFIYFPS